MGRSIVNKAGLTPKQEAFKNEVVEQITSGKQPNLTQAAMKVYGSKTRKSAQTAGSKVMSKGVVKDAVEDALSAAGLSYDAIMKNIAGLASSVPSKITGETVLKANIEALKIMKKYPGTNQGSGGPSLHVEINGLSFDQARSLFQKNHHESSDFIEEAEIA